MEPQPSRNDGDDAPDDDEAQPKPRPPLSPERIFVTAFEIVDRDGIDKLTMRRLASALEVEPMSLYHHVPSKEDLLNGIAAVALAEIGTFDDLYGTWQDQIRAASRRLHRVLIAHPRVVALVAARPTQSGHLAELAESGLARLRSLGFSLDDAIDILWLMNDYVFGNVLNWIGAEGALESVREQVTAPASTEDATGTESFPNLAASLQRPVEDADRRFDKGLDLILAGIELRIDPR